MKGLIAVVMRLGHHGTYLKHRQGREGKLLPPYHVLNIHDLRRDIVPNAVGDDSAFLGAYCYALANPERDCGMNPHELGAIYGTVAASFAIEQIGMPKVSMVAETLKIPIHLSQ